MSAKTSRRRTLFAIRAVTGAVLLTVLIVELKTSWLQSEFISAFAKTLSVAVVEGPAPAPHVPEAGPYNHRLGYTDLERFSERLAPQGFAIERQAQLSPQHRRYVDLGGFPVFAEKSVTGLTLLDRHGDLVYGASFPGRVYGHAEDVPPLVTKSLLFIENRELLDPLQPRRNPAVEWDRLALAVPRLAMQLFKPDLNVPGGSTLATQIEKFRHAPEGRTANAAQKLRQMISASVRAYRDGVDTQAERRRIALDYINGTPLSARRGFGEVNGLGDGLFAWFGVDFDHANRLLRAEPDNVFKRIAKARVYKQVLALFVAQRRPSYYLMAGRQSLGQLVDRHLRLLIREGVIEPMLGETALGVDLRFADHAPAPLPSAHVEQKATNAIRADLLTLLDVDDLYRLDRLDLTVESSIDGAVQKAVTEVLSSLTDPAQAEAQGLYGHRLLDRSKPHDDLIVSLTVYERGATANHLRVQADNLDQPFDINQGAKLDLGSTAKLRTLISYLEAIEALYRELAGKEGAALKAIIGHGSDPLTRWAAERILRHGDYSLQSLLAAAVEKRYAASTDEAFFTGGGLHRFANFDPQDDGKVVTVRQAMRHSVNLPLIRMMRDVVAFHQARLGETALLNPDHPQRSVYLERFAEQESSTFLSRFYRELASLSPDVLLDRLASQVGVHPNPLSILFRSVRPDADEAALAAFLQRHLAGRMPGNEAVTRLFARHDPIRFTLADRAHLLNLHPLKLWLAAYLVREPHPARAKAMMASAEARRSSMDWLFKSAGRRAQDLRIRQILEKDAFAQIHEGWQRLGYPFQRLVPSYASALGSSADRPDALATLVGIILNDGLRLPTTTIQSLHFAQDTAYETFIGKQDAKAEQVLSPQIANLVREIMIDVVEHGTARRLNHAFDVGDGRKVTIGAKTGTGDHRNKVVDRNGEVVSSEVVNRTATVAFFIGDRLFGNLTVFVPGQAAGDYGFTSSLAAQLLRTLAPTLAPLLPDEEVTTVELDERHDV